MENVIYIAGPMRGLPDLGRRAFSVAEGCLRARGWKVINPACLPPDLPEVCYMPICFAMLHEADAIALLPGWDDSVGASMEADYAEQTGKLIFTIEELTKVEPGEDRA